MSEQTRPPTRNRILDALPREDYDRIAPLLEPVEMRRGATVYHPNQPIDHLYFPTGSMVSLVSQMAGGAEVEVGVAGFEGVVGLPYLMGSETSPHLNIVQLPDGALRARASAVRGEFRRGGALLDVVLRYTQSLLVMSSQTAACNALHTLSERLAKWLLMCQDRTRGDELPLTQEFLSTMLGVRRAGVTEAAIVLQAEGLIKYRRGHITVLDREGLESFACECYPVLKAEFNRQPV
jgi:CRP-like cAMP-binding protein